MAAVTEVPEDSVRSGAGTGLLLMEVLLLAAAIQLSVFCNPLAVANALGFTPFMAFHLALPAATVLTSLALPVLAATSRRWMRDKWIAGCVILYSVCITASTVATGADTRQVLTEASRITVPVALAVSILRFPGSVPARELITAGFCLIWMLNVYSCIVLGRIPGIGGNVNWVAAATLATSPFVYIALVRLSGQIRDWMIARHAVSGKPEPLTDASGRAVAFGRSALMIIVAVLTGQVVLRAGCRAAFVAVAAYLLIRIIEIRSLRIRLVTLVLLCFSGMVSASSLDIDWRRMQLADVRIPTWYSTIAMVTDRPILGHGPNQFRRHFVDYRSLTLNLRTVTAIMTHPHNETLLVAANLGIPAAIVWLVFCWAVMLRRSDCRQWESARFAAITLFVLGQFERTLADSSTAVIFPLVMAILLAEKLSSHFPSSHWLTVSSAQERYGEGQSAANSRLRGALWTTLERGLMLTGGIIFGLASILAVTFAIFELRSDICSWEADRRGRLLELAAQQAADPDSARALLEDSFSNYRRACEFHGTNFTAHLQAAGYVASEILGRSDDGRVYFNQIRQIDPNSGFVNYLIGRCDLRDAFDPALDEDQRMMSLHRAIYFLNRDIKIHPFATRVHEQLILALAESGQHALVCDAQSRLSSVYQQRLERLCELEGVSPESLVQSWLSADIWDSAEKQSSAQQLTEHISYSDVANLHIQRLVPALQRVQIFVTGTAFLGHDVAFWRDLAKLNSEFGGISSPEDLLERLAEVKASDSRTERFAWPSEVWNRRAGTPMEAACLLAAITQQCGHECLLLKVKGNIIALLEWNGNIYRCQPKDWQWRRIGHSEWEGLSTSQRRRALVGSSPEAFEPSVFVYPHALRHRNRALFEVVNVYSDELPLPENPYVTIARTSMAFPELAIPVFAIEPFERLEFDLH